MANHGYAVPPEMPTFERVDAIVRRVVSEKFPMLLVESDPNKAHLERSRPELKGYWLIYHPGNRGHFGLEFWFGSYLLDGRVWVPHVSLGPESVGDTIMERVFAVEFRHGHAYDILWWIEYEIREAVGRELGAAMFDDGAGYYGDPLKPIFGTFLEYQEGSLPKKEDDIITEEQRGLQMDFFLKKIRREMEEVPEDVWPLYGVQQEKGSPK
jgi:hypothetical protein